MIVFLTSIRHPENAASYPRIWQLLNNSLVSVCSQTDENFRVIVVCNKILPLEHDIEKIERHTEFVEVDFPSVPQTGLRGVRSDKAAKYTIGVIAAEKYRPDHMMFFDSDDFIGGDIAEFVNARRDANGFFIHKGYRLVGENLRAYDVMNEYCGTGNILRFDFLRKNIPENLNLQSSKKEILRTVEHHFLFFLLGSHKFAAAYFAEKNTPLIAFPHRSVIQFMGTGEGHSDYFGTARRMRESATKRHTDKWRKITAADIRYFHIGAHHEFVHRSRFKIASLFYNSGFHLIEKYRTLERRSERLKRRGVKILRKFYRFNLRVLRKIRKSDNR